jgi:hypothetical protein
MNDVKVHKSEIHGYPVFTIEINRLISFYWT